MLTRDLFAPTLLVSPASTADAIWNNGRSSGRVLR
jgi:hypothetical protein